MKNIVIFISIIIAVLSNKLDEEKEKLEEIHEECQSNPDTYADDELLKHLKDNLNNSHVQAHMLCESTKVGLQDEDGELNTDVIREKIKLCVTDDDKKVDELVEECAVQRETSGETAVYLFMCLDGHNITYFHEF